MNRATEPGAGLWVPGTRNLSALAAAVQGCRGCQLYRNATQAVFGEGESRARLVLIGEQPGAREDEAGRPFVGPAGRILDQGLAAAGIDRREVYVTNAVKHFKWERRGKYRLHKKPLEPEIRACLPWLEAELEVLSPDALLCMGTTAVRAVFGRPMTLRSLHDGPHRSNLHPRTFVTVHPSAIVRIQEEAPRHAAFDGFVGDLVRAAAPVAGKPGGGAP